MGHRDVKSFVRGHTAKKQQSQGRYIKQKTEHMLKEQRILPSCVCAIIVFPGTPLSSAPSSYIPGN